MVTKAQDPSENIFQNRKINYDDDDNEVIMEEFDDFDEGQEFEGEENKESNANTPANASPERRKGQQSKFGIDNESASTPKNENLLSKTLQKKGVGLGNSLKKNQSHNLFSGKKEFSSPSMKPNPLNFSKVQYSVKTLLNDDNESPSESEDNEELKQELEKKDRDLKIMRAEMKNKEKQIEEAEKMIQFFLSKAGAGGDFEEVGESGLLCRILILEDRYEGLSIFWAFGRGDRCLGDGGDWKLGLNLINFKFSI